MKKIILLLILVGAGYQAWVKFSPDFNRPEPLYDKPYVVVYGRDTCSITQKTLKDLKNARIPYEYKLVDDKAVASELHSRMEAAGIDTRRYNLPVVDVNNQISVRPVTHAILEAFDKPLTEPVLQN